MRGKKNYLCHLPFAIENGSSASCRCKRNEGCADVMMVVHVGDQAALRFLASWIGCYALTF